MSKLSSLKSDLFGSGRSGPRVHHCIWASCAMLSAAVALWLPYFRALNWFVEHKSDRENHFALRLVDAFVTKPIRQSVANKFGQKRAGAAFIIPCPMRSKPLTKRGQRTIPISPAFGRPPGDGEGFVTARQKRERRGRWPRFFGDDPWGLRRQHAYSKKPVSELLDIQWRTDVSHPSIPPWRRKEGTEVRQLVPQTTLQGMRTWAKAQWHLEKRCSWVHVVFFFFFLNRCAGLPHSCAPVDVAKLRASGLAFFLALVALAGLNLNNFTQFISASGKHSHAGGAAELGRTQKFLDTIIEKHAGFDYSLVPRTRGGPVLRPASTGTPSNLRHWSRGADLILIGKNIVNDP